MVCAPFKCHLTFFGLGDHPSPAVTTPHCVLDKGPAFSLGLWMFLGVPGFLAEWVEALIVNPHPHYRQLTFPALGCVKGWFEVLLLRTLEGPWGLRLSDPVEEVLQSVIVGGEGREPGGFLLECPSLTLTLGFRGI